MLCVRFYWFDGAGDQALCLGMLDGCRVALILQLELNSWKDQVLWYLFTFCIQLILKDKKICSVFVSVLYDDYQILCYLFSWMGGFVEELLIDMLFVYSISSNTAYWWRYSIETMILSIFLASWNTRLKVNIP